MSFYILLSYLTYRYLNIISFVVSSFEIDYLMYYLLDQANVISSKLFNVRLVSGGITPKFDEAMRVVDLASSNYVSASFVG